MAEDTGDSGSDNSSDGYGGDSGGSFSSGFGGDMESFGRSYNDAVNAANGWGGSSLGGNGGRSMTQGELRALENGYLDSTTGAQSYYDAMTSAWKGNLSDTSLSRYMDAVGIGYDQRANLLGGFDALSTGRGGFGDFASSALSALGGLIPGYNLLSGGIDIAQRLQHGGVVGGNLLGGLVGGLTGNGLLGQAVTYGTNLVNGDTISNQLKYGLQRNAGSLLSAAGVPAEAVAGINLANTANNFVKQTGLGNGISFGSNSGRGLF